jgi:hypothetical protein
MTIIYSGNPFTHVENKRESTACKKGETCSWCGQIRRVLYKYNNTKGWFCNKQCNKAYNS